MSLISLIGTILYLVVLIYSMLLFARFIIDWVTYFARDWHPKGIVLVLVEFAYSVTDPPLKLFRRFIPPLRLGSIQLDMSFLIVVILCSLLLRIFGAMGMS